MNESTVRRTALVAVLLTSFATPFMVSGVNVALPAIGSQYGISALLLSWVATSYSLTAAVFLLPFGKLADMYGRKRVFLLGTGVYAIASALCALANSAALLIAFRVVQGVGAAMLFCTSTAILSSVYPPEERGKVLGISVAMVYMGSSAGPFLGGLMVESLGWRSVFWFNVPLCLCALGFTFWKVRGEWVGAPGDRFDVIGAAIYGLAVVALMLGFSQLPSSRGIALILAGALGGTGFILWERRDKFPVLETSLFRGSRVFTFSSLAALANYMATSSVTFLLSLYLQYIKALSPREAGLVLVAQPIMQALFSPLAGRLSDRVGARYVASIGMAFTVTGLVLLTFLGQGTARGYITLCLLILGFGFALFSSPNTSALMGAVERRFYGTASSIVSSMRLFGQMLSMGITMILFGLYFGGAQVTPAIHDKFIQSMRASFTIFAVMCGLGILASLARGRGAKPTSSR